MILAAQIYEHVRARLTGSHDVESAIAVEIRDPDLQPRADMALLDCKPLELIVFGIPQGS